MSLDFDLNDWVEIWLTRLSPLVKKGEGHETLIERYERVSKNFFSEEDDDDGRKKEYREKLLGPDLIAAMPQEYSILSIVDKIGYMTWEMLSLSEQAKLIAYYRLESMAELIKEHLRTQERQKKELMNKNKRHYKK